MCHRLNIRHIVQEQFILAKILSSSSCQGRGKHGLPAMEVLGMYAGPRGLFALCPPVLQIHSSSVFVSWHNQLAPAFSSLRLLCPLGNCWSLTFPWLRIPLLAKKPTLINVIRLVGKRGGTQHSSQGQGNPCCLHATWNKQFMDKAMGYQNVSFHPQEKCNQPQQCEKQTTNIIKLLMLGREQ